MSQSTTIGTISYTGINADTRIVYSVSNINSTFNKTKQDEKKKQ